MSRLPRRLAAASTLVLALGAVSAAPALAAPSQTSLAKSSLRRTPALTFSPGPPPTPAGPRKLVIQLIQNDDECQQVIAIVSRIHPSSAQRPLQAEWLTGVHLAGSLDRDYAAGVLASLAGDYQLAQQDEHTAAVLSNPSDLDIAKAENALRGS